MGLVEDGSAKSVVEGYVYTGAVEDKVVGRRGVVAKEAALFSGARFGGIADVV